MKRSIEAVAESVIKALVDADILTYRVGFTTQEEDINIAKWRMDDLVQRILESTNATEYQMYLTASKDSTAFRKKVYPDYKANRKSPRPIHYEALREHLVNEYGASVSTTIEADDAIGIDSRTGNCIVVSIDKDLLQLPGLHYNFVKDEFTTITPETGLRFFYKQLLMGDKADNIKGVDKIGEVKAERILNSVRDPCEEEWFEAVQKTYNNNAEMHMNGVCLWILQSDFPKGTWSYHPLGSTLIPEMEREQLYSQNQSDDTSDASTQEMCMDGQLQHGSNLTDTTISTEEQLNLTLT